MYTYRYCVYMLKMHLTGGYGTLVSRVHTYMIYTGTIMDKNPKTFWGKGLAP